MDFLKASHFLRKKGPSIIDASALKSLGIFLRKVKIRMISGEIFYALHACIAP